eukprot:10192844-Ditylum_brightwellii.AAC.2
MQQPLAYLPQADPDTMQYHQAMKEPDKAQFIEAIVHEVNTHTERKHWSLIPKDQVPEGVKVLSAIWKMKRKRDIRTGKIRKWKAHLNVHGGQQVQGVNYWETYGPVVTWFAIRLLLILSLLNNWSTRRIDLVSAYPQTLIECNLFMALPARIAMKDGNSKTHVLRLE